MKPAVAVLVLASAAIAARYGDRLAADRSDPEQDLDDRTP